ncbi:MAG: hypothetical protein ACP5VN_06205 [Acidobacteriota bacterium]
MASGEKKREETSEREVTQAPHVAARPMKVVMDEKGCPWLCDADVNPHEDLASQGCWRCSEVAFTRND